MTFPFRWIFTFENKKLHVARSGEHVLPKTIIKKVTRLGLLFVSQIGSGS